MMMITFGKIIKIRLLRAPRSMVRICAPYFPILGSHRQDQKRRELAGIGG